MRCGGDPKLPRVKPHQYNGRWRAVWWEKERIAVKPSSRTPEGKPNLCPVCGKKLRISPSRPPGDAPCPHCGHLLWFGPTVQAKEDEVSGEQENGTRELVELAKQKFDKEELTKQEARRRQIEFTLNDFKQQLGQIRKLGPIQKIISMIPGVGNMSKMLEGQKSKRNTGKRLPAEERNRLRELRDDDYDA
jgi:uncharacterized Zn finger protein (UPF0148 family)